MEEILKIKEKIEEAKSIAVFGHTNTDGDSIGSMCAMFCLLQDLGKHVDMFVDSVIPEYLYSIKNAEKINEVEFNPNNYDLLISVDTAVLKRVGMYAQTFASFENTVLIDHHISNERYAKICYVDGNAPACGQVLFNFFKKAKFNISLDIGTCLLSAIVSDTNAFTNSNVTKETFEIASKLIALGVDYQDVVYKIHKEKTLNQIRMAGFLTSNIKLKNCIAYVSVSEKQMKKLNCKYDDVSKFTHLINNITGAKITLLFKERCKNLVNVSFRSLPEIDVNQIASKFNGGGHKNAAACIISGKLKDVVKLIYKTCKEELEKIEE
ncbi:MAG: bifunctional oligoribonuclease/PAP phosphatase NrnA [Clostridia bacterium]|nr:bifunctional oligoribonuclease/PAP phosphatase NrnA [Clostridia bacterium]